MTALNVIQTHDAVYMVSDGAFVDQRTGNLITTGSKVFANTPGRFAIGVSGSHELLRHIGMIACSAENIEQARGDIETLLPRLFDVIDANSGAFGIYLAGFSESDERQLWKIEGDLLTRQFASTRMDSDAWHFSPAFTSSALRLAIGDDKASKFDRCFNKRLSVGDPIGTGMLAMEAQRKLPYAGTDAPGRSSVFTVGAFAQITVVTRDRIESRILKRWPDALGQRINPDGAAKVYQSGFGTVSYVAPVQLVGFKGATDAANGILTGSSSNYSVNSSAGFVAPTATETRISGGTPTVPLGGTAANINDNSSATTSTYTGTNLTSAPVGSRIIAKIDYGSNRTITKIDVVSISQSLGSSAATNGLYYSTDNVNWTQLGAGFSTTTSPQSFTRTGSVTARYVAVALTQDNYTSLNVVLGDLNGYSAPSDNMTLVTAMQTADASVSNGRVLLEFDNSDSPAINTDLTVEVTCDGGAHWTLATVSSVTSNGQGGRKVVETADTACTSGTSFAARIKTLNNKNVPIYALTVSVH